MNTRELIDQVKLRHGLASDYAAAAILDIPTSHMSNYRSGRRTLDDTMALKVAALLELDPGLVMTWIHQERAERAGRPDVARALDRFARRVAMAFLAAIGVQVSPPPAHAAEIRPAPAPTVYYVKSPSSWHRRIRQAGFALAAFLRQLVAIIA